MLLILGAVETIAFADHHHLDAATVGILCGSLLVGAALGVARGFTVRLWVDQGRLFRQGTALTVALWLVAVGIHLASETAVRHEGGPAGASSATMLLYLGLALTIQTSVLRRRARARLVELRNARGAPALET